MRKIFMAAAAFLVSAALTGCTSTGLVHDKSYLRIAGMDGKKLSMTFFADEKKLEAEGMDLQAAVKLSEIEGGKNIVTGFTEMAVLGECDFAEVLGCLLKNWKVSPSCMIVYSQNPEKALKKGDSEQLEGSVREFIKQGKAPECDIVTVLGKLLNDGEAEIPEISEKGAVGTHIIAGTLSLHPAKGV